MKIKFPKATVNSQMACITERILSGAYGKKIKNILKFDHWFPETVCQKRDRHGKCSVQTSKPELNHLRKREMQSSDRKHDLSYSNEEELWDQPKHVQRVGWRNGDSPQVL